jgi:2-amino-4-hydroxy-6-hydroxymethyldihydropteridine diphosphokinase
VTTGSLNESPGRSVTAYIGIGSNLHGPVRQVQYAVVSLGELPESRLVRCSPLYRNPAMGPGSQPDFVNAVAALETRLDAYRLLDELQAIEARQRRQRGRERWAPRTLDLDLLMYGNMRVDDERLTVPHPGLAKRAFVLHPLAEIAPMVEVPGLGPLAALLAAVPGDDLERIGEGVNMSAESET